MPYSKPKPGVALRELLARPQSSLFGAALLVLLALYGFVKLADHLGEPRLGGVDRWLLALARTHVVHAVDSPAARIAWNLTALGSTTVLTLVTTLAVGLLLLQRAPYQALYAATASLGGALLTGGLKAMFSRARPNVVQPLVPADGFSFPSGHALGSTVVYLTLAVLLATRVRGRLAKLYVLSVALLLAGLIGISRVLLGVHYPSDVLAGWMVGVAWALSCWLAFELWMGRTRRVRSSDGRVDRAGSRRSG